MMVTFNDRYVPLTRDWNQAEKLVAIIATATLNIAAIFFNLMILITIIFSRRLRKEPDSILIGNLALSDLLVACCIMPFTTDILVSDTLNYEPFLWTFIGFSNFFFCIASILNLVALSFDQLMVIKWPFRYNLHRKQNLAFSIALLVWVYSGLCTLPPLFGISSYTCFIPNTGTCSPHMWSGSNDAVIFTVLVTMLTWGMGIIVLVFSNLQIYKVIVKQRVAIKRTMVHKTDCPTLNSVSNDIDLNVLEMPRKKAPFTMSRAKSSKVNPENKLEGKKLQFETRRRLKRRCSCIPNAKQATSLLIIVIVYFISWSPFCIVLLIEVALRKKQYENLSLIFLWVGHLSSFLNPVLYFYRFRRFRNAAKSLYRTALAGTRAAPAIENVEHDISAVLMRTINARSVASRAGK